MIGQKGIPSRYGGVETHVEHLATRLVRSGSNVTVYARSWYTPKNIDRYNGVRVVHLPSLRTKHLDAITHTFFSLLHACLILRADVIHIHAVGPALLAWIPRLLRPHAIVVTTFHCIDRHHEKWNAFARWMLHLGEAACVRFSHQTITVSKTLTNYIALRFKKRAVYIPNGIQPRRTTLNDAVLAPFKLRSGAYVAMVARLVPHKGAHTLIEAWKVARELRPELLRDLKLAIVGDSAFTDAYVKKLHTLAEGDASIVFTGYQTSDTLEALFSGARFLTHPSTSEGLPIAILEAMSYGKCVIASDIPENREVIEGNGVSFVTGSIEDLAQKIIERFDDPAGTSAIGHGAREFVEIEYHWDDIAKETIALYEEHLALREGVIAM